MRRGQLKLSSIVKAAARAAVVLIAAAGALDRSPALAQDIELAPQVDGATADVDVTTPEFEPVEGAGVSFWQHEFDESTWRGAQYLRLHISAARVPAGTDVQLVISDRSGRIVESYDAAQLGEAGDSWTKVIPGDYALVSLVSEKAPAGVEVRFDKVAYQSLRGVRLSIIGVSELQGIEQYARDPLVSMISRPVAKLVLTKGGAQYTCTGFMVEADVMMTNEHCVNTAQICRDTVALFDYQIIGSTVSFGTQFRCRELIDANRELDYARLRLDGRPGDTWGVLNLASADLSAQEPLLIIQHPAGRRKEIAFNECAVTEPVADGRVAQSDFAHKCDTEGGSSGSPVFTRSGEVVGLHHFGVGDGPFWNQNRAVRMSRILEAVGQR